MLIVNLVCDFVGNFLNQLYIIDLFILTLKRVYICYLKVLQLLIVLLVVFQLTDILQLSICMGLSTSV